MCNTYSIITQVLLQDQGIVKFTKGFARWAFEAPTLFVGKFQQTEHFAADAGPNLLDNLVWLRFVTISTTTCNSAAHTFFCFEQSPTAVNKLSKFANKSVVEMITLMARKNGYFVKVVQLDARPWIQNIRSRQKTMHFK